MENRGISRRTAAFGAIILVLVTALVTFGLSNVFYSYRVQNLITMDELRNAEDFDRFITILTLARTKHVEEVSMEDLLEGAMEGAIKALEDPYSSYYDASKYEDFKISVTGHYSGIGVVVEQRDGQVLVQTPFDRAPGATTRFEGAGPDDPVGLRPGDVIIKVDDYDVTGLPVDKVAELIRGEAGTIVRVTVTRDGYDRPLEFNIKRAEISIPTVESAVLDGNIGYLKLNMFTEDTANQSRQQLANLRSQGVEGLILDLRNNPGGSLEISRQVAELFIPSGPVVHIVYRDADTQTLYANNPKGFDMPLVVLVNGGSASASEIVAGAIQDTQSGTLVGTTTFGKGSVQTIWDLDEGTGVKITTARYLTPNKRSIDKVGIEPDILIEMTDGAVFGEVGNDPQLDAGIKVILQELGR